MANHLSTFVFTTNLNDSIKYYLLSEWSCGSMSYTMFQTRNNTTPRLFFCGKPKRHELLTVQVRSYCLLALKRSIGIYRMRWCSRQWMQWRRPQAIGQKQQQHQKASTSWTILVWRHQRTVDYMAVSLVGSVSFPPFSVARDIYCECSLSRGAAPGVNSLLKVSRNCLLMPQ